MNAAGSRVHHVVALVRPENFVNIIGRMSTGLQTAFYGPFDRPELGIRIAMSMDAGIELITPICTASDDPLIQSLDKHGERWISVIVGVRDLDDACARLEALGHQIQYRHELPFYVPIADRYERLDEYSFSPEAFHGLPVVLARIIER